MKTMTLVLSLLTGAAGPSAAEDRIQVENDGDDVEISVQTVSPAEPRSEDWFADSGLDIPPTAPVADLVRLQITAFRQDDKLKLLERIGRTKPATRSDLRALLNLHDRGDLSAQAAVERSIALLSPRDRRLTPFFLAILGDEDPKLQLFGLLGVERLRPPEALPMIRKIASSPFKNPRPQLAEPEETSQTWLLRFHCLEVLAAWERPKTLPLLRKRSQEAPSVAKLIARYYWRRSFNDIVRWSESRKDIDRKRAIAAWNARVPRAALRKTLPRLWAIVIGRSKRFETRHQAAIKLGFAAGDEDVDRLLSLLEETKNKDSRLILKTALFATRSKKAVPLLIDHAKSAPDPVGRAGALVQLRNLMDPEPYRELLRWVAEHDKDDENRNNALRQLGASH